MGTVKPPVHRRIQHDGAGQPLCLVLRPSEAGAYISRHLPAINEALERADRNLVFDLERINGECHLPLPLHYCAIRAQNLANSLNNLKDERGRCILEVEISSQPSGLRVRRERSFRPPAGPELS